MIVALRFRTVRVGCTLALVAACVRPGDKAKSAPVAQPAAEAGAREERPDLEEIQVCVVERGGLRNVSATYNRRTGDTTVAGQSFSEAYPATNPPYALTADWFVRNESFRMFGERYEKFGIPRYITAKDPLGRIGRYEGV